MRQNLDLAHLQQKFDVDGKLRHVNGELPPGDPAVVEAVELSVFHNRRAQSEFGDQPYRPHGHFFRVAHLKVANEYQNQNTLCLEKWFLLTCSKILRS
jgi:hypothetical protein